MRIPVVDGRGIALMPCTAPKARALLKAGKALPKRNKLGLFYVQLTYVQEPNHQRLVVGIDPGSSFEGFSVVGTKETVCNLMVEAVSHVKQAVETRRTMRRARRFRLWRRPCRSQNRLARQYRLPPSTRSRWEAKARVVRYLASVLPLTDAAVEDVQAAPRPGSGRPWNTSFQKNAQTFSSHAVDAWVLAATTGGAKTPTCTRLWYGVPLQLHRRQLHRLQPEKGGIRKPYGGTRSLGFKRGTVIHHPRYGCCIVGGYDREKQRVSLHAYKTNKRLTQGAKPAKCHSLTSVAFRSWLVPLKKSTQDMGQKGAALPPQV
jgi:hypothetical protein